MSNAQITIKGLDKLIKKARRDVILAEPLRDFFKRAVVIVQRNVKRRTPVDRGGLRNNVYTEVDNSRIPTWGKIGTNEKYAKPVEFGTGLLSDAPDSGRRRYFPPPAALDLWASRHGIPGGGYAVARAIYLRGGTKPVRMFREGLKASQPEIAQQLQGAKASMEKRWGTK